MSTAPLESSVETGVEPSPASGQSAVLKATRNRSATAESSRTRPAKAYLPWLDLLRLVACFLVIVNHLGPPIHGDRLGHAGVGLFFSISGFLIGTVLLNSLREPGWLALFYAHRFLRIYPAYLAALVFFGVLLLCGFAHNVPAHEFFSNLVYYLTFTFRLAPLGENAPFGIVWSLCVEEYFYLFLPLLFLLGSRRRVLVCLLAVTVLNLEPRFFLLPNGDGVWFFLPHNLIGGAIAALLRPRRTGFPWVGIIGLGILLFNAGTGTFHPFGPIMAVVTTSIVWSFATTSLPYPRRGAFLLTAGKLSYGVYLLHLPVCSLVLRLNDKLLGLQPGAAAHLHSIGFFLYFAFASVAALSISTVMALGLNWAVERPASGLRKYLPRRPWLATTLMIAQVSLIPLGLLYHLLRTRGVLP